MHDIDDYPQARTVPGLVVYRYDAPLFFANAQDFRRRALAAARSAAQSRPLARAERRSQRGGRLHRPGGPGPGPRRACPGRERSALARVKQDLLVRLEAFGLAKTIGPALLFPTLPSAVDAYRRWATAHPPPASREPGGDDPDRLQQRRQASRRTCVRQPGDDEAAQPDFPVAVDNEAGSVR